MRENETRWLVWVDTKQGRFSSEGDYSAAIGQVTRDWRKAWSPRSRAELTTYYHVHTANLTALGRFCTYCRATPETEGA